MNQMFRQAYNFNQPLDDWNVASVTDMGYMFRSATYFNQCLSTWADKTPPDVNVYLMFQGSGCPDKSDPNPLVGPWCQGGGEQCESPGGTSSLTNLLGAPKQKKTTKKNNKN